MEINKRILPVLFMMLPTYFIAQVDIPKMFKMNIMEAKINSAGQYKAGKVMLKWLPDNLELLQLGQKYGFKIERADYSISYKDNFSKYKYNEIANSPVFPWSKSKLEKYLNDNPEVIGSKDYEHLALAYEVSVGADTTASARFLSNVLEDKTKFSNEVNSQNYHYVITVIASCFSNIAANAIGIYTEDDKTEKDKKYIYRISLVQNKSKFQVPPSYIVVDNNNSIYKSKTIKVKEGEQKISLLWDKSNDFVAFNIYYSQYTLKNFEKANNIPILNNHVDGYEGSQFSVYTKDSLINFKEYFFRVNGINIFGEEIEIGQAKGTPKDLTPPERPILSKVSHFKPKVAKVDWKQLRDSLDVLGYKVYRSNNKQGSFNLIHDSLIPAHWRSFNDNYFDHDTSNYYIVSAVDKYGNQSFSDPLYLTLIDSTPPMIPVFISGQMDSLGIVTINLKSQKEKDFMGYRVYKANAPDHEFSVIKETFNDTIAAISRMPIIKDTTTLKTLTKYIYYRITSMDYHYNESKFSAIIKIKRIDTIKPVSPLISDILIDEKGIVLYCVPSTSEDVVMHNLYKRIKGTFLWSKIFNSFKIEFFRDSLVEAGVHYEYKMEAIDDSGLTSASSNVAVGGGLILPLKVIKDFNVGMKSSELILNWKLINSKSNPNYIYIYRSDEANRFYRISIVSADKLFYIDKDVKANKSYSYKLVPFGGKYDYDTSEIVAFMVK